MSKHHNDNNNNTAIVIDNVAFTAIKDKSNWVITLKPGHFHQSSPSNSFAIYYDDIFYGVFLLTDKIHVPILMLPNADLVITSLDAEGKPLASESYTLGEANDNVFKTPGY